MQVNLTFLNPIEVRSRLIARLSLLTPIFFSPEIGSSNQSRSHTWPYLQNHWTALPITCKYIRTSAEVYEFALHAHTYVLKPIVEWNSGNRSQVIGWSTASTSNVVFHTVKLKSPVLFEEISSQAEWGSFYYAMGSVSGSGVIYISSLIVNDLGKWQLIQDSSGYSFPSIFCELWGAGQPNGPKLSLYRPQLRSLCHFAQPRPHPSHRGSCRLGCRTHYGSSHQLHRSLWNCSSRA